jgi:cytochrome c oxidase assembly factor CtaG/putative copper export protein
MTLTRSTASAQAQPVRIAGLATVVAACVLVIAMVVGGGAPTAAPPGIPDPGALTEWGLPLSRLIADLAAIATVGLLLVPALLLPARSADLRGASVDLVAATRWTALGWSAAVLTQTMFTVSDFVAAPVSDLRWTEIQSVVFQISQGRALAAQVVIALVVALLSRWVVTVTEATFLLLLALVGLTPPVLTGHAASAGSHDLAVISLLVHVLAVSLWVGGLIGLLWATGVGANRGGYAVTRFSTLAGWCIAIVAVSGVLNAAVRLGSWSPLFTSGYGQLVLAKAACLLGLAAVGATHRRRTVTRAAAHPDEPLRWGLFARLATGELALMAATIGIAVALSRTPTPVGSQVDTTPVEALLGGPLPPAPTLSRLIWSWTGSGVGFLVVGLGGALYIAGLVSMRRRGSAWPVGRTVSWFVGLAIVGWATCGGLGVYSHVLFSAHMVLHMAISMVAPIFLVLGAPVTLALRTLPGPRIPGERSPRGMLTAVLHSRVVRFFTQPLIATAIFVGSLYGLYFTSLFGTLMASHLGHAIMQVHFLLAGSLFFYVLVGIDPAPRRLPAMARLFLLLLVIPLHAFFSIAIMSDDSVLGRSYWSQLHRPYRQNLLDDQHLGGSLSWALGEVPMLVVIAAIFVQWLRSDTREGQRHERREARRSAGDTELDAYNRYLARLNDADRLRDSTESSPAADATSAPDT